MLLPFLLITGSIAAAAAMAYGTHPDWVRFSWGLDLIVLARQLQWPLAALSLVLVGALVVLVVVGRRRVWWLVGLMPVLALFVHRFATDPIHRFGIIEQPPFVAAEQAGLADDVRVIGVVFKEKAYAFPCSALHRWPVVAVTDFDARMLLLWSPFAGGAWAAEVNRDLKVRDLEILSMPANGLLLYNSRVGQFVSGVTGRTHDGRRPVGFETPLPLVQTTWGRWRHLHSQSQVLAVASDLPDVPLPPRYQFLPGNTALPDDAPVVIVASEPPTAIPVDQLGAEPVNLPGDVPAVVFRDAAGVRALDRRVEDLVPRFGFGPGVTGVLVDSDTGSSWAADGRRLAGPRETRGLGLRPLSVQDGICYGTARFWHPNLKLHVPSQNVAASLSATGQ